MQNLAAPQATLTSRGPLSDEDLRRIDAYWRAANYLSVGQIYLLDNPLLSEPLGPQHVKPRLPSARALLRFERREAGCARR